MDYSIVIALHNEEDNVEPVTAELRAVVDGRLDYEIVWVDDGSSDGTAARLQDVCRGWRQARMLRHAERSGKSAALRSGIRAARAPWIITLDGDGQNDPTDILVLVEALEDAPDGVDLVAGLRRRRADRLVKKVSSKVANAVRRKILGDGIRDSVCGLKVIRRDAYLELPYFDHMHRFFPALIQRRGGKVIARDVEDRERLHGASKYGFHNRFWVGIVDLLGVLWLQRRATMAAADEIEVERAVAAAEENG